MASYKDNKWLIVNDDVKMTPIIEPVIIGLDKYFEKHQLKAYVTAGERDSVDQLNTIRKYCKRYKVDLEFPEVLTCKPTDKLPSGEYVWQKAWSRLLNIGVIINPPFPAIVLFDYFRDGKNKKGKQIGHSPHYYKRALDIGGGTDHDITNEVAVVEEALKDGLPGLVGYLPERKNNCTHLDCKAT